MEDLKFKKNWNNKCSCEYFTTIRLKGPKYAVGKELNLKVYSGGVFQNHGIVRVHQLKPIQLHQINEYISRLDSGLSPEELRDELYYMYKDKVPDVSKSDFYLILCQRVKTKAVQNTLFASESTPAQE